jgi:hypothetical protein
VDVDLFFGRGALLLKHIQLYRVLILAPRSSAVIEGWAWRVAALTGLVRECLTHPADPRPSSGRLVLGERLLGGGSGLLRQPGGDCDLDLAAQP